MPEKRVVVRPSMKLVTASYAITILVLAAAAYGLYGYLNKEFSPWHLLALVLLFIPIRKHVRTRMVSLAVDNDHLTVESGFFSRARRTLDLAKIQDVTAKQTIMERILGIGDLTLESAGQSSAIFMKGVDSPRAIADLILERAKEAMRHRAQGTPL